MVTMNIIQLPNLQAKNTDSGIYCLIPLIQDIASDEDLIHFTDVQNSLLKMPQDIYALDKQWIENSLNDSEINKILTNEVSMKLKSIVENNPYFDEIFLTGNYATIIAASNKTSDYYQGDEEFYHHAVKNMPDGIYISASTPDRSAKAIGQKIAVPIMLNDNFIGVLAVIVGSWYNEFFKACGE